MERLESVIIYILLKFGRSMTRTELVKSVYLFEYLHYQRFGKAFSEARFIRDYYGPNDPLVYDVAEDSKWVKCSTYFFEGHYVYHYSVKETEQVIAAIKPLPPEIQTILDQAVLQLSSFRTATSMKNYVYKTPPMETVLRKESSLGRRITGRPLDMSENKSKYRPSKSALREARRRVDRSTRGSNKDYYANLVREIDDHSDLKERAEKCLENN